MVSSWLRILGTHTTTCGVVVGESEWTILFFQANKEAMMSLIYRAEIEDMPSVYHNVYGISMACVLVFFPFWNRDSVYQFFDTWGNLITPMVTMFLPGYMLTLLTSPARPHHKFVRAETLLLADALAENDFSEDEEFEEEAQNEIERLKKLRDSSRAGEQKIGIPRTGGGAGADEWPPPSTQEEEEEDPDTWLLDEESVYEEYVEAAMKNWRYKVSFSRASRF